MGKDLVSKKPNQPVVPTQLGELVTALDSDQDVEILRTVEMAEDLLIQLGLIGVDLGEKLPKVKDGETAVEYVARVWDKLKDGVQAQVEVNGISRMVSLGKAGEKAVQQRLYRQFVTGTWEVYAQQVGINFFRDYVYYVLREAHGLKDSKAGRWADALQVIGWIYQKHNQDMFGLDPRDLPATAQECIHTHLNRLGRVAARLLNLIAASNAETIKLPWEILQGMKETGGIDPDDPLDQHPANQVYRRAYVVRKMLGAVFGDPEKHPQDALDQMASGRERPPQTINWPEEVPVTPEQRRMLEDTLGDRISFGVDLGKRVQYKLEMLPHCPYCGNLLYIKPYYTTYCPQDHVSDLTLEEDDYRPEWFRREESDTGMTPWEPCAKPSLETWSTEVVEVVGITAMIFNTAEEE